MKYSVGLQPPFSFSPFWYLIGLAVIVLAYVLWHLFGMTVRIKSPLRLDRLRRESMSRIDGIELAYQKGEIDTRAVYQQMSREVRRYTQIVTGWRTSSMVPDEMRALAAPEVGSLMQEYYRPEFAYHSEADPGSALQKGRQVVEAVHQFAVREKKAASKAAFRSRISLFTYKILQILPKGLKTGMIANIRKNTLKRIDRIENDCKTGKAEPHFLYLNLRTEVRSFIRSITGLPDDETAIRRLRGMLRPKLSTIAKDFYEPEFTCHSIHEVTLAITKARGLITKWV